MRLKPRGETNPTHYSPCRACLSLPCSRYIPILKLLYVGFLEWVSRQHVRASPAFPPNYAAVLATPPPDGLCQHAHLYRRHCAGQMALGAACGGATSPTPSPRFRVTFQVVYLVITSWVIVSLVFRYIFSTEGSSTTCSRTSLHLSESNIRCSIPAGAEKAHHGDDARHLEGMGWNLVVFLTALQSVPQELYEIASMEAAGLSPSFFYITPAQHKSRPYSLPSSC